MSKFERHPLSAMFPSLAQAQMVDLEKDIKENGQITSGMVFEDKILDGWHRYLIMQSHFKYLHFKGTFEDAVKYVMSMNIHRRHLTDNERLCLAAEMTNLLKKKRGGYNRHNLCGIKKTPEQIKEARTDIKVAKALNVSTTSISRAIYVHKRSEDAFSRCKNGEMSVNKAYRDLRRINDGNPSVTIEGIKFPDSYSHYIEVVNFLRDITKKGWGCNITVANGKFDAKFIRSYINLPGGEHNIERAVVTAMFPVRDMMKKGLEKLDKVKAA